MAENINIKEIGKMYELGLVNDDTEYLLKTTVSDITL
jgi:hypothetical protein